MNKLFFSLICGCLMLTTTMKVLAQEESNESQSGLREIALNGKNNPEIRKLALEKANDQNVFKQIASNGKENTEIRKLAMSRIK